MTTRTADGVEELIQDQEAVAAAWVAALGDPVGFLKSGQAERSGQAELDAVLGWRFNPHHGKDGKFSSGGGGGFGAGVPEPVGAVEADLAAGRDATCAPDEIDALMGDLANEPSANLAHLTVTGAENVNCYSRHAREIPRSEMPQLPESAVEMGKFTAKLSELGATARLRKMDPRKLEMTQNQLDTAKVGKLYGYIKTGGWRSDSVIIASREGAILDGHHRWAAASASVMAGKSFKINVLQVDMGIDQLLNVSAAFSSGSKAMSAPLRAALDEEPGFPPPNEAQPWVWFDGEWWLVATDTADDVPDSLDDLRSARFNPHHGKDGKFSSGGSGGGLAFAVPPITEAEARGNSRAVSDEEFQALAAEGEQMLESYRNAGSLTGLDQDWDRVKAEGYMAVQKPWGGATVNAHTGQTLHPQADVYAVSIKPPGMETVSVRERANRAEFDSAMDVAKERFRPELEHANAHLGLFHDDDNRRIDIDPVTVVGSVHEVEAIGAFTHAIGGAYHFKSGDGYYPPHVGESRAMPDTSLGRDVHWAGPGQWRSAAEKAQKGKIRRSATVELDELLGWRHNPNHGKDGKFVGKGGFGGAAMAMSGLSPEQYAALTPTDYSDAHRQEVIDELSATPEGAVLADTMVRFQEHEFVKPFRGDVETLINGGTLPADRAERAQAFLDGVKGVPPGMVPPRLYRGMTLKEPPPVDGIYKAGSEHAMAIASFSSSRQVSESYQEMTSSYGNTKVMVELTGAQHMLPIQNLSKNDKLAREQEWVGSGTFKVTGVTRNGSDITVQMAQEAMLS